jgi:hypothetical protein
MEISMKVFALLLTTFSLFACGPDGPAERLGEGIDDAIENTGDAIDDAVDEVQEAADEVEDNLRD